MTEWKKKRIWAALFAVACALPVCAPARASHLFISTSPNHPTEVAGGTNPSITVAENATVSLYLWWQVSDQEQLIGLGHSVQLSNPILSKVSYDIDNPTVSGQSRWINPTDAGQTSANVLVQNAGAFQFGGSNFGLEGAADPFYDSLSGTYRFSVVSFKALSAGSTDLNLAVGQQGIAFVSQPDDTLVNFGFGDAGVAGNDFGTASSLADAIVTVVAADSTKPWMNPVEPLDVNGDTFVTPLDALVNINELNANGPHDLPVPPLVNAGPPPFRDTDGNNKVQPLDVLLVVNFLNANPEDASLSAVSIVALTVPEPSSAILAVCGLVVLSISRSCMRRARLHS